MFLKKLLISAGTNVIREILFHKGLNLIVDETKNQTTGNNVGKTTVLKLIDFCLGGSPKDIYTDPETKKDEFSLVKDFLTNTNVLITLVLTDDLDKQADDLVIERNFLNRNETIRRINGEQLKEKDFETKLSNILFPQHLLNKPSFRQIISHNFRYSDERINNTLKTLHQTTKDVEYETLFLFLFGCNFTQGNTKQEILAKIKQEETYKSRLEKKYTKTAYEQSLSVINSDIDKLNYEKLNFNLNENFEKDLTELNKIKRNIGDISSVISQLDIRISLIKKFQEEIEANKSDINLQQLKLIYQQAKAKIDSIQKTFDELVSFHNKMIDEKVKFLTKELPALEESYLRNNNKLKDLIEQEKQLTKKVAKSTSFDELEKIIAQLTKKHLEKGEYEGYIQQIAEVESNLKRFKDELSIIDNNLFSDDFEEVVKNQLAKFNTHFATISDELYGERFLITYDIAEQNAKKLYKFSSFNMNMSSGQKQGEISCFELAYILFAKEEKISCLHFILNDKKELMDDKQLVKIAKFANQNNIQFVASILNDKLPQELNNDEYIIIKLSQNDKLFRIESLPPHKSKTS